MPGGPELRNIRSPSSSLATFTVFHVFRSDSVAARQQQAISSSIFVCSKFPSLSYRVCSVKAGFSTISGGEYLSHGMDSASSLVGNVLNGMDCGLYCMEWWGMYCMEWTAEAHWPCPPFSIFPPGPTLRQQGNKQPFLTSLCAEETPIASRQGFQQ